MNFNISIDDDSNKIAVAISGGADSTALIFSAYEWASKQNIQIIGLTVNHNLRSNSFKEALEIKMILNKFNIEHYILNWNHSPVLSNIQSKARAARYELLTNWCKENSIKHLLLGHNKNDVAETFLINSLRGSGVYGLSSISEINFVNSINIHRPLLNTSREEILLYLKNKNLKWIDDPSNSDEKFLRTKVRNIITQNNLSINMLALTATNLKRARGFIEQELNTIKENFVQIRPEGYLTIALDKYLDLHQEIALLLISDCLKKISGQYLHKPRLKPLEVIHYKIHNGVIKNSTLWGCEIVIKKNFIYIYREIGRSKFSFHQKDTNIKIWDGRFEIFSSGKINIKSYTDLPVEYIKKISASKCIFPKKIWRSLPYIELNKKILIPFIDKLEDHGIKISIF